MDKSTRTPHVPHLLSLERVAKEIGIAPDTIVRHPNDFFAITKLGGKRYVASASYAAWLAKYVPGSGEALRPEGVPR